jgi:hypothetical protein
MASAVPDHLKVLDIACKYSRKQDVTHRPVFGFVKIVTEIVCRGIGQCRNFDVSAADRCLSHQGAKSWCFTPGGRNTGNLAI